jgi:hypothetical protein
MVEVLTGGVANRRERMVGMAEEAKEALRRLEQARREGASIIVPSIALG